jgi:hypothetical protein
MTKEEREIYEMMSKRYAQYKRDPVKSNLCAIVLMPEQAEVLSNAGFKTGGVIMRSDVPAALKALESSNTIEEISLF